MSVPSFPSPHSQARREIALALLVVLLTVLALCGPVVANQAHQHAFADQRTLWGVPCALDVLSNLPFALAGVWGLAALLRQRLQPWGCAVEACAALFFVGLVLTACGSAWYHSHPDDAGLLWDRLGMAVAFAGMLGMAAATRVSCRAGVGLAGLALVLAPAAAAWWAATGNVWAWVVVQVGGILLLAALAALAVERGMPVIRLAVVLGCYGLAKLLEAQDHAVWELTQGAVAGHALKHLLAAAAALPVLAALLPRTGHHCVQNGAPGAQPWNRLMQRLGA